jgi:hypothetical protein
MVLVVVEQVVVQVEREVVLLELIPPLLLLDHF